MNLSPGIHRDVPMRDYLALDAIGSSRLGDLAVSPLFYHWRSLMPRPETVATEVGTAVHCAILEPTQFVARYVEEPDVDLIGGAKPRATKEYKQACEELAASGQIVLKRDTMIQARTMASAVRLNPHAAALLARSPEREVTLVWERDGRLCKARPDIYGPGAMGDIKTTRNLRGFSPFEVTRLGYYRRAAHYLMGAEALGHPVAHYFFIAVENTPPFDVAVYELDESAAIYGRVECESLFERFVECEESCEWPGMFPSLQIATVTDHMAAQMAELEGSEEVA